MGNIVVDGITCNVSFKSESVTNNCGFRQLHNLYVIPLREDNKGFRSWRAGEKDKVLGSTELEEELIGDTKGAGFILSCSINNYNADPYLPIYTKDFISYLINKSDKGIITNLPAIRNTAHGAAQDDSIVAMFMWIPHSRMEAYLGPSRILRRPPHIPKLRFWTVSGFDKAASTVERLFGIKIRHYGSMAGVRKTTLFSRANYGW